MSQALPFLLTQSAVLWQDAPPSTPTATARLTIGFRVAASAAAQSASASARLTVGVRATGAAGARTSASARLTLALRATGSASARAVSAARLTVGLRTTGAASARTSATARGTISFGVHAVAVPQSPEPYLIIAELVARPTVTAALNARVVTSASHCAVVAVRGEHRATWSIVATILHDTRE